jgi:hypothetical protein|tara:strand:+ start:1740 stop:2159 length:420 start_codon:yes stop_codon:yes gene_type:complete
MTDRKTHLTNPATWIRLGFMLVFALLLMAGRLVISIIVVVQFALVLVTGSDNENLRNLGQGLGKWIYQAFMFLTFNSEEKPFPFDEWPTIDPSEGYSVKSADDIEEGEFVDAQESDDVHSVTASEDIEQAPEDPQNKDS